MAEASTQVDHSSFFWRKLHSLTGLIPIGAYLCLHLWENSYALVSPEKYDEASKALQTVPYRILVELAVLGLPIAYHAFYGFWVWWTGKVNVSQYPWVGNWMYTFQRWTGVVAFVFIGWHVWTTRILEHGKTTYEMMAQQFESPWLVVFYVVGVTGCAVHLGIGIWNFACKWGLAVTRKSQNAIRLGGWALAAALSLMGLLIVLGFHLNWHPFDFYTKP